MRGRSSHELAMRNPAYRALFGDMSADFGFDPADVGDDGALTLARQDLGHGADQNAMELDMLNRRLGSDQSRIEMLLRLRQQDWAERQLRAERRIHPNRGLTVRISRYDFTLDTTLVIGVAGGFTMTRQPFTTIHPERVFTNAPCPAFCTLSVVSPANVGALLGGATDAFTYSIGALSSAIELITIKPQYVMNVAGNYTGIAPAPYVDGLDYPFVFTIQGSAHTIPDVDSD
jgi:hypothetical protein